MNISARVFICHKTKLLKYYVELAVAALRVLLALKNIIYMNNWIIPQEHYIKRSLYFNPGYN